MPTFNPPLGRETTVPITSEDHDRYVHLSFSLSFEIGEDASGSWELWTDIPDVDDQGHLITGPGEWRAVPFVLPPQVDTVAADDQSEIDANKQGFVITIPASPVATVPIPLNHTLIAHMVVPAHNASFAYTYRRVLESGDTRWLGNGGDNGIVRIVQCENTAKHVERKEWKGVGIELKEDQAPVVHQLPVDASVKASILLLQSVPSIVQPIHQLFDSPRRSITHEPESLVIVSNDLRPVSIQRNSTSPVAAGLQEHFDATRSFTEILADVCKDYKSIEVITDAPKGVVAFCYHTSPCAAYLIVHNTIQQSVKLETDCLAITRSDRVARGVKELSTHTKGYRYIKKEGLHHLDFDRASDDTRNVFVFHIIQFNMLPGKGSFFPLAGDRALSQELYAHWHLGDYEKDLYPGTGPMYSQDWVQQTAQAGTGDAEASASGQNDPDAHEGDSEDVLEVPDLISDDGDSIRSGSDAPSPAPALGPRAVKPASFFSWIKRLFAGFWSWLFGPSTTKRISREHTDDDEPASGTVTPNERTHLLSSPQTSAATSSTAVSPSNTPDRSKDKPNSDISTEEDFMTIAQREGLYKPLTAEQMGDQDQQPMVAILTLPDQPFKLIFEPALYGIFCLHTLCYYRRVGDKTWFPADLVHEEDKRIEGCCDEAVIKVHKEFFKTHNVKEGETIPYELRWEVI